MNQKIKPHPHRFITHVIKLDVKSCFKIFQKYIYVAAFLLSSCRFFDNRCGVFECINVEFSQNEAMLHFLDAETR